MNYKKLYYKLCNYCKTVDINQRIKNRNPLDERLGTDIYTEKHHIIPKHSGGTDVEYNLVEMLPEEHFMAHLIRYKAYNDRNDFISIRFMLNGFNGKPMLNGEIPVKTKNKMVKMFKSHMSEFRKKHGWHTEDGLKRISEARKGTIPVRNSNGDVITVDVDHPKVLSGEWRHHTHGTLSAFDEDGNKVRITSDEYKKNKDKYTPNVGDVIGESNPRYSGITDEQLIDYLIDLSKKVDVGYLVNYSRFFNFYRKKYDIKIPKTLSSFRFNDGGTHKLYEIASQKSGMKINKHPRGELNETIKNKINKLLEN